MTKESPALPEKVLTGCKNSSLNIVPSGILFVLASALNAAKAFIVVKQKATANIKNVFKLFIKLSSKMHPEYSISEGKNQFSSIFLKLALRTVSGLIVRFLTRLAATRAVAGTQITIAQLPIKAEEISVTT